MDSLLPPEARPGSRSAQAYYIALAALVGLLGGVVGSLFHLTIDFLVLWPDHLRKFIGGPALVVASALITMAAAVLSVFLVRRFAPEASGSGIQEIEGAMEGLRTVRWARVLPVKFVGGSIAIGSGLVLGREGPTIHIAASLAAMVSSLARVVEVERRGLLAAGAAAGLACAFNAPVAAVLFVIEETHKQFPYTFRTYMGIIAAAIVATAMTELIGGVAPDMALSAPQPPMALLPLFLVLGGILGVVGVLLNASLVRAMDFAASVQSAAPYLYPSVIGLVVGALFILAPLAVTGGETVVTRLVVETPGIPILLLLAVLRFATMVGSYSSGAPGGLFAPILALAVCLGLVFGVAMETLLPASDAASTAFAIAAMGGLFTASVRAPVVGVVLTLELTGSYSLALPVLATCLAANITAQWLGGRPIYEQLLDRTLLLAGLQRPQKPANQETGLA